MNPFRLLQTAVFGGCEEYFLSLPDDERTDAVAFIHQWHYEPLFLPSVRSFLSQEDREAFKMREVKATLKSMVHARGLEALCRRLEEHRIRHCRIKGTDLAYRIYPQPAMRYFNDWDIFFYPEDCERAVSLLKQEGWRPVHETVRQTSLHHLTPMKNGKFTLEPHLTLVNLGTAEPLDLWTEIQPSAPGSFRYLLSPELNLLMLTRHAASGYYRHVSVYKLYLDTAFLLKKSPVDWKKVHDLADRWGVVSPDDILGGWQEYLPAEVTAGMTPDPERVQLIQALFSEKIHEAGNSWNLILQDHIFSWSWLRSRLTALRPEILRKKYHGRRLPYPLMLMDDLWRKFWCFLKNKFHPEASIRDHMRAYDAVEKRR